MSPQIQPTQGDSPTTIHSASPILHLPNDILTEIFRQFHWAINLKAPFVLTRVCSRWRKTAIDDPVLWSHVKITPSKVEKAKNILRRSGSFVPLSILIRGGRRMSLHWLEPYMPRIQELLICGQEEPGYFPDSNLDRLERLTMRLYHDQLRKFLDTNRKFPSLRRVTLNERSVIYGGWEPLPAFQLTHLTIDFIHKELIHIFPLLRESSALRHLELKFNPNEDDTAPRLLENTPDYGSITLPHLQSVTLWIGCLTSALLKHITLPVLKRMSISRCGGWLGPVKSLAERSSFNLTHLSINECYPPGESSGLREKDWDDQIIQILKCISSIEHLQVTKSGALGRSLLEALGSTVDFLGPSLKTFSMINLESFESINIPQGELLSTFKSRTHGTDPGILVDEGRNMIVLHHNSNMAEDEFNRVRELFSKEEPDFRYARHMVFRS